MEAYIKLDSDSTNAPRHFDTPDTTNTLDPSPMAPPRRVSARLFGSQGANLGLDLDLVAPPLSVTAENVTPSTPAYPGGHYPTSATSTGSGLDSPAFPFTPTSSKSPFAFANILNGEGGENYNSKRRAAFDQSMY
ncbi:hypothetical protein M422DRAFT_26615 [Sphaerobolus stellatus SS14]|nr:hypothetical protein M422DRAFT_26615 [Sphaerobolus stellatus SS14]